MVIGHKFLSLRIVVFTLFHLKKLLKMILILVFVGIISMKLVRKIGPMLQVPAVD